MTEVIYDTTLPIIKQHSSQSNETKNKHIFYGNGENHQKSRNVSPPKAGFNFKAKQYAENEAENCYLQIDERVSRNVETKNMHKNPCHSNRSYQSTQILSTPKKKCKFEAEAENEANIEHFYLQIDEPSEPVKNEDISNRLSDCSTPKSTSKNDYATQYTEIIPTPRKLKIREKQFLKAVMRERNVSICHSFIVLTSIISISVLTKVTNKWEKEIRRCPLFVTASSDHGIYWGNEKMVACHYVAYMPVLSLIMSLSFLLFHASIVRSWHKRKTFPNFLHSMKYSKTILCLELIELATIISAASVLIDGIRQTCLSFQLNPWVNERPESCKEGFKERDEIYGLSKTYTNLIVGLISLVISVCASIVSSCLFLFKAVQCRS